MPEDIYSLVLPAILIGVIGLLVGGVAGFLLAGLQNSDSSGEPRRPKNLVETIRVWKDKRTGVVMVEAGQKLYQTVGDLSVRQRQGLLQVLDDLRLWLGVDDLESRITQKPPTEELPLPLGVPQKVPAAAMKATIPSAEPVKSSTSPLPGDDIKRLLQTREDETAVKPPSMDITDILSRAVNPEKPKPVEGLKSIASQVDDIVQARLPASEFRNRTIKVLDHPKMGLLVLVDGEHFEGVNDVTDEAVRHFLRECVAAWEDGTSNVL